MSSTDLSLPRPAALRGPTGHTRIIRNPVVKKDIPQIATATIGIFVAVYEIDLQLSGGGDCLAGCHV